MPPAKSIYNFPKWHFIYTFSKKTAYAYLRTIYKMPFLKFVYIDFRLEKPKCAMRIYTNSFFIKSYIPQSTGMLWNKAFRYIRFLKISFYVSFLMAKWILASQKHMYDFWKRPFVYIWPPRGLEAFFADKVDPCLHPFSLFLCSTGLTYVYHMIIYSYEW